MRFYKPNWLELYLNHSSIWTNDKFGTISIGDSTEVGLSQYQNVSNGNFSFSTLNCDIGNDEIQNVLWRAHNFFAEKKKKNVENVKNVEILCSKRKFKIKVCPVFIWLYRSRQRWDFGQWFPKSRTFLFRKNSFGAKTETSNYLNLYAKTLEIPMIPEISTIII